MVLTRTFVIALAMLVLAACHSKSQNKRDIIPLGYYATRTEAQHFADSANTDLAKNKAAATAAGVEENALSCGQYKVVSTRNSDGREFWGARLDTSGCSDRPALPRFSSPPTGAKKP